MKCRTVAFAAIICVACDTVQPAIHDQALDWQLDTLWSRGGLADPTLVLSFLQPYQVSSGPTGNIFILDAIADTVFILDRHGQDAGSVLSPGRGPAELESPFGLWAGTDGTLSVLDPLAGRLVFWAADSTPPGELHVPTFGVNGKFAYDGGVFRGVVEGRDASHQRIYKLIEVNGDTSRSLATAPRPAYSTGDFPSCGASDISGYPLLSAELHWSTNGHQLAFAGATGYAIHLENDTGSSTIITRPLQPFPADSTTANLGAAGRVMNGCPVPPAEVVKAFGYAPMVQLIAGLILAPDGGLFVDRRVRHSADRIDYFDVSHTYVGTLPSGFPMPVTFIDRNTFLSIGRDSTGVPIITETRIHGNDE